MLAENNVGSQLWRRVQSLRMPTRCHGTRHGDDIVTGEIAFSRFEKRFAKTHWRGNNRRITLIVVRTVQTTHVYIQMAHCRGGTYRRYGNRISLFSVMRLKFKQILFFHVLFFFV